MNLQATCKRRITLLRREVDRLFFRVDGLSKASLLSVSRRQRIENRGVFAIGKLPRPIGQRDGFGPIAQ